MSTLQRTTFEISRAAEYFKPGELEKQTGQPEEMFAAVAFKELVDNALDAAETKAVAPEVDITVEVRPPLVWLTVTDNGNGLPAETVGRILNFNTRTSDKSAYRAPTRGAQGNALKTVIGIPVALQCAEPVVIEACGVRHTIHSRLGLDGAPRIVPALEQSPRHHGTSISAAVPVGRQKLDPAQWARRFSLFNPHTTVRIRILGETTQLAHHAREMENSYHSTVGFPEKWRKFLPIDPTSAWWYSAEDLTSLIGLHNAAAEKGERALTLRDFVKQFRGLSASAKAKQVCDAMPHKWLRDFNDDAPAAVRLLAKMQAVAEAPSPGVLGRIGEEHFRTRFAEWYGVKRFWYRNAHAVLDGIPFFFEVAVAETHEPGEVFTAVNFSPTFGDPFAATMFLGEKIRAMGIHNFLQGAHVLEPWSSRPATAAVAVHLVCPTLHFLDRAKSRLNVQPDMSPAISKALEGAVRDLYREGEKREKDAALEHRRREAKERVAERRQREDERTADKQQRQQECKLNAAVFAVMLQGMANASGNGATPVSAKTLHYQVRRLIQEHTAEDLTYDYFSKLLPIYRREFGPIEGLYYDPRGVLYEPHGGRHIPIGTRDVESYQFPLWGYDKILYIEKKGFWPAIQQSRLADKYDMAVMACEGYATEAARVLFSDADRAQRYRLFVLHDADPDGYEIARTLREATARMPDYKVEITDLGLRYEEALEMGLQTERFTRKKRLSARLQLTEVERQAFTGEPFRSGSGRTYWSCERVELNAFSNPQLLAYIERKLIEAGAADKLIPPESVLTECATITHREIIGEQVEWLVQRIFDQILNVEEIRAAASAAAGEAARVGLDPLDFSQARGWIETAFALNKSQTWRQQLSIQVRAHTGTLPSSVEARVEQFIREQVKQFLRDRLQELEER